MDPKDIAVLTPYNAQAAAISRGLMQRGVTGVTVTSITKSQGKVGSMGPFLCVGSAGGVSGQSCEFIYYLLSASQGVSGAM